MKIFLELLPYRLKQALVGDTFRKALVSHKRRRATHTPQPCVDNRKRLFVDVSAISTHDAGTGIQRVVRALAASLPDEIPVGWNLQFVAARRGQPYNPVRWPPDRGETRGDQMHGRPGDIFLGLDYCLNEVRWHQKQLSRFRRQGGSVWFLVHDLLPIEKPQWFSRNTVIRYRAWLEILAGVSDGFLCNSDQTERQLREALKYSYGVLEGYDTKVLPMGHRILDPVGGPAVGARGEEPMRPRTSPPFFLIVGTLEPRKGHADVLAAFDILWRAGRQERLVIAGRVGWKVKKLQNYILTHSRFGRELFWFNDVEDEELDAMYKACEGSIVASHAEGFGLPLIEALGYGKPVLARALPIFQPHAKYGVRYFPMDASAETLASCIAEWAEDIRANRTAVTEPKNSWHESAKELIQAIT